MYRPSFVDETLIRDFKMAELLVEAGSFASLVALAEDPPTALPRGNSDLHLHQSANEVNSSVPDPFVLYIARVPGSKGMTSAMRSLDLPEPSQSISAKGLECNACRNLVDVMSFDGRHLS